MTPLTEIHLRVLRHVHTSFPWNWRGDVVEDLEKIGLVKIEHGRAEWHLTNAGREVIAIDDGELEDRKP